MLMRKKERKGGCIVFLAWFLVYILDLPSNVLTLSLKCDSLLPWTGAIQLTMQMEVQNQLHEQLLEVTPITL